MLEGREIRLTRVPCLSLGTTGTFPRGEEGTTSEHLALASDRGKSWKGEGSL